MNTYNFGTGSFSHELWLKSKFVFAKPTDVNVEFVTSGAFDWVFADGAGNEVRTFREENPLGKWHSVNLPSLGLHGDYSIGFRNASSGQKSLKGGSVTYS